MNYYPEFAVLLDRYLSQADRSGAWLAQRLGVNPATVTRWRNGDTRPNSPEMVIRLADVLGLHEPALRQQFLHAAGYGYLEGSATTADASQTPASAVVLPEPPPAAAISPLDEFAPAVEASEEAGATGSIETSTATMDERPQIFTIISGWYRQLAAQPAIRIVSMAAVLCLGVAVWAIITWPVLRSNAGVQHFAVGEWQNLSPGVSPDEASLTEGTRQLLYQKLSQSGALQGIAWGDPQVTEQTQHALDVWIEGSYQQKNQVELKANLYKQGGVYLTTVAVQGPVETDTVLAPTCYLDLQNQLAGKILGALKIKIDPATLTQMDLAPTHSCAALRLNNQAAELVMDGSLQSAQPLLEKAIALDSTYADAYNNRGQLFYRQGDWTRAVQDHQHAQELQPHNPIYPYNLGLDYDRLRNYPAAIHAYEQALDLDPTYIQAYNNFGFILLQTHELTRSLDVLQRGLALDPKAYYLHKNIGRVYLEQGNPARAVAELQQAIELFTGNGGYPEALYYLAVAHQALRQTDQACAALAAYSPIADQDEPERATSAAKLGHELACPP